MWRLAVREQRRLIPKTRRRQRCGARNHGLELAERLIPGGDLLADGQRNAPGMRPADQGHRRRQDEAHERDGRTGRHQRFAQASARRGARGIDETRQRAWQEGDQHATPALDRPLRRDCALSNGLSAA